MTKLKNSNCDKTQKLKLLQNSKTQNSNCDKTQKLKLFKNSKTQIMTKLKKHNTENNKFLKKVGCSQQLDTLKNDEMKSFFSSSMSQSKFS